MKPDKHVFLLQVDGYDPDTLGEAFNLIWHEAGLRAELRSKTVLIKPNILVGAPPEKAVCTHPEVVRALIRSMPESYVLVGDSPGLGGTLSAAGRSGIASVCREEGAHLVDFAGPVPVEAPHGRVCRSFPLASAVHGADAIISAAKLKTHGLTRYTGAVKNLFGCLPGQVKPQLHLRLQETDLFAGMLVDLYTTVAPVFSVVDGIVAMEGNGPRNGTPRHVGILVAGRDAVAVDAVACAAVGIEPLTVPTTRIAHERDVGCGDLKQLEIIGASVHDVLVRDFQVTGGSPSALKNLPPFLTKLLREQLTARPYIQQEKCTGCAVCTQVCQAGAVSVHKIAEISRQSCIRCYCCQELCPEGAIVLKKRGLGRFFS